MVDRNKLLRRWSTRPDGGGKVGQMLIVDAAKGAVESEVNEVERSIGWSSPN